MLGPYWWGVRVVVVRVYMSTHHQAIVQSEDIKKDKQNFAFASIHCLLDFLVTAAGTDNAASASKSCKNELYA